MARSIAVLDSAILALIHKVLAPRTCPKMKNNCAAQPQPQPPWPELPQFAREELRKIYQCKSLHCQPNGSRKQRERKRGRKGNKQQCKLYASCSSSSCERRSRRRSRQGWRVGGPCEGGAKFPLSGADKAGQVLTIYVCNMYMYTHVYIYVSIYMYLFVCVPYIHM